MGRIAYVNGRYQRHGEAVVHIEDRGFQFADGVYEYFSVFDAKLADAEGHLERLWRSLSEIRIRPPMSEAALMVVLHETVRRNRIRDGSVYLQITRGAASRDHAFPHPSTVPSVVVTAAWVSPRWNSAEPWTRGKIPTSHTMGRIVAMSRPSIRLRSEST